MALPTFATMISKLLSTQLDGLRDAIFNSLFDYMS